MPYKGEFFTKKIIVGGKPYWVKAKTQEELTLKADRRKKELEAGLDRIKNPLVEDWCIEWLDTYKPESEYSSDYIAYRKSLIDNFLVPVGGYGRKPGRQTQDKPRPTLRGRRVADVKGIHLQTILNSMAEEGYSEAYIKKVRVLMGEIFRQAVSNDLMIKDPTIALKKKSGKSPKKRRPITAEERRLTLQVAEEHRGGLFFLFILYCGLRPQEVAALEWSDIDLEQRLIHVTKALKRDGSIGAPKSDAGTRYIPIPEYLCDRIRKTPHASPVKRVDAKGKDHYYNLVCVNSSGGLLTRTCMRELWRSFKRAMNLAAGSKTFKGKVIDPKVSDDLTPYCYRHTYCTDLQAAGIPINVARERMGHSDISVTAEIYTHQSGDSIESARAKLDAFLGSKKAP